jgi:peptidoglycan hydrolase CwlO-like protein
MRPSSNWAQIVSAITSSATTALAIWAIFFSSASQTVVDFLQSELAIRNSKIVALEKTSEGLQIEIQSRQAELSLLSQQISVANKDKENVLSENKKLQHEKDELGKNIDILQEEIEAFSASYSRLRIKYVAGKFYSMIHYSMIADDLFLLAYEGKPIPKKGSTFGGTMLNS